MAWKDGEVVLDNTPLEEALWMLEKRYSVKFVIKNEKLKNSSFTGTFTNQRLEKIHKASSKGVLSRTTSPSFQANSDFPEVL